MITITKNNNHGGARAGAGKKKVLPPGTKARGIQLTDAEFMAVKVFIKRSRDEGTKTL